ncbi:hypothetical protein JRG19_09970 [Pseudoclavibacter alba]|uniref:hypothetical protein n=1 Tax=Pseudoclavibacter albus TaxID=272241 RepID=UPI0019D16C6C|nr:hypothetical protein [Pseudoclavibacter alba]MBN6778855.1 hypothetical protein [Pseudoclavibacter alba]
MSRKSKVQSFSASMLEDIKLPPRPAPRNEAPPADVATTDKVDPAAPTPTPVEDTAAETPAAVEAPVTATPDAPSPAPAEPVNAAVNLTLPVSLFDRVDAARKKIKVSYPVLVMTAIEATYTDLPDLLAAEAPLVPTEQRTSLFGLPNRHVMTAAEEPKRTKLLRFTKSNRDVLNNLTEQFNASSRNALLHAALRAYLDRHNL